MPDADRLGFVTYHLGLGRTRVARIFWDRRQIERFFTALNLIPGAVVCDRFHCKAQSVISSDHGHVRPKRVLFTCGTTAMARCRSG
jgi:hypothetical protein